MQRPWEMSLAQEEPGALESAPNEAELQNRNPERVLATQSPAAGTEQNNSEASPLQAYSGNRRDWKDKPRHLWKTKEILEVQHNPAVSHCCTAG